MGRASTGIACLMCACRVVPRFVPQCSAIFVGIEMLPVAASPDAHGPPKIIQSMFNPI